MITFAQAIATYPELARLYTVMTQTDAPWVFRIQVEGGEPVAMRGLRMWPDSHADQLGIKDDTNAACARRNPLGEFVWMETGTLADVVDKVLEELVPPHDPAAPSRPAARVIAAAGLAVPFQRPAPTVAPGLWLPT